jgi:protein ImuB
MRCHPPIVHSPPSTAMSSTAVSSTAMPSGSEHRTHVPTGERRILAIVLPELLEELVLQRIFHVPDARAPQHGGVRLDSKHTTRSPLEGKPARAHPDERAPRATLRSNPRAIPRAIVLSELQSSMLEPTVRLDAVNVAARQLGVSTRQTIAQATALVEQLALHTLLPASVSQALKRVAEAAMIFGSPVSFQSPDTVWVEVTGSKHLFGGERELALTLAAHVRALGHSVRVAVASGPWLAQSFARHADFDETGVFFVDASGVRQKSGLLPIGALPITSEAVAWFARLGLLSLEDLRKLPRAALAARLEASNERTLDLIDGRDDGVLDGYVPEELPFEEQSWDFPLESVEPLLFVLKGLSARLGARLEGRGQAAQELLLTIRYDRAIAALRSRGGTSFTEGTFTKSALTKSAPTKSALTKSVETESHRSSAPRESGALESLEIPFRLASPLAHAEDLERIVRSRLQRETLSAPSIGVRLQVTAITEAQQWQQSLDVDAGLGAALSADPRTLAVLMAELSADIGEAAIGMLEAHESHLLEKSSCFVPLHQLTAEGRAPGSANTLAHSSRAHSSDVRVPEDALDTFDEGLEASAIRQPTRLISPIEFRAPLREKEIVVLDQRAFVIEAIQFEERLEAVEWWAAAPVSRDYFRLWLSSLRAASSARAPRAVHVEAHPTPQSMSPADIPGVSRHPSSARPHASSSLSNTATGAARIPDAFGTSRVPSMRRAQRGDGLEVLVYLNRDDGRKYVQALYD